jgi:hypothetical protein
MKHGLSLGEKRNSELALSEAPSVSGILDQAIRESLEVEK